MARRQACVSSLRAGPRFDHAEAHHRACATPNAARFAGGVMARKNGSPNYVEFPFDKEMVVTLAEDRGRLSENDYGEYFLRKFDDGRFTCANPDLERRIIDTGARRGSVVSITKEKY